ncbi:7TM diverse intracellular signaling domain-containing protein [Oligoflexus tunisiensis]|uniref:7TM diverse intracellular signaling domain-containing protein n=1 Tax=Oligoflexus tunisiensis TaxID=708132 RepID=UPI000A606353|nr:7TM diverse intracellular signaling domain-containing protein [Oligoflexus tunisiensis]
MKFPWLAIILNILLLTSPSFAAEPDPLDISKIEGSEDITRFGRAVLDEAGRSRAEMEQIVLSAGRPIPEVLQGGYTDGYYWIHLPLTNSANTTQSVNLAARNLVISHFETFIMNPGPDIASIARIQARIPTLSITLGPFQKTDLLLKIQFGLSEFLSLTMEKADSNAAAKPDTVMQYIGVFFGILLAMTTFNVGLFLLTREKVFLFHAMIALLMSNAIFILSGLSYYFLGTDSWNSLLPVFGNYTVAGTALFAQYYVNASGHKKGVHRFYTLCVVIGLIGGTLLLSGVTKRIVYVTDLNLVLTALITMAVFYNFPPHKHRMMRFYVLGWLGFGIFVLIWAAGQYRYAPLNFLTENALSLALCFEMIVVSLGLADQINDYKNRLEQYSRNLEMQVEEKVRDIRSIMDHIPLGIFMIQDNMMIHKDHSKNILQVFPKESIESLDAKELIFSGSNLSPDELSQAVSCLEASLGEDIVNFDANSHALPLEIHRREGHGPSKIFEMTWGSITDEKHRTDKILVTMRDVTDIRMLQARSKYQEEELDFIREILRVPAMRFTRVIQSCRDLMQENKNLIQSQGIDNGNTEVLKLLFINIHTIKGSARSLYLQKMADVLHAVEQYYADLLKSPSAPWDLHRMEKDLAEAERIIDLYDGIARDKLGRSSDPIHIVEFGMEQIEHAYRVLSAATQGKVLPADVQAGISLVKNLFHARIFKDARDVIKELCGSLPALARDLQKEVPRVEIETNGIRIGERAEDLFRNIFVHLLRNTMDHGIESAEERIRTGKNPQGTLKILMEPSGDTVALTYSDNGRGLNIGRIRAIGLARNLLDTNSANDIKRVAELIFDSGLSTAHQVTEISGRGVGMDAVKRFIQRHGGSIAIALQSEGRETKDFHPFSLVIRLPLNLFDEYHWSANDTAA